jgi:beta-glucanase (GH16 family)
VKPYVGGFIDTLGAYARTYGKFEFRARFPKAVGVWYAIWATPWSQPFPEIDIEITNLGAPQLWLVNHWAAPPLPADSRRTYFVAPKDVKKAADAIDFDQFHTYTMIWEPGFLQLRFDGETKLERTSVGVPDLPLAWRISSWVGGWGGAPTAATPFPVAFEVDYMRVYRVDGLIAPPSIRIMNSKSSYNRTEVVRVALANFDEACAHVEMYDGETRLETKSAGPLQFRLSGLKPGQHKLSFVATDGTRSTVASVDALIK